jgi:hypothetical protein
MLTLLESQRAPPQDGSTYFSSSGAARDHINAMGMPDDGTHYDYEGHLRSMGGGTFVAKECCEHCCTYHSGPYCNTPTSRCTSCSGIRHPCTKGFVACPMLCSSRRSRSRLSMVHVCAHCNRVAKWALCHCLMRSQLCCQQKRCPQREEKWSVTLLV